MPYLDGIEFSTVGGRMDRDWIWDELIGHAYWAKYRTRAMFDRQLDTAWRVVGAYGTDDAHGLYETFGFAAPDATFMERAARLPNVRS